VGPKSAADLLSVVSALAVYERRVLPRVRSELRRWEESAVAIPDPDLRAAALSGLREKRGNAEATAVFAILAPRAQRGGALRAMTALQVAIDYLDSLGEAAVEDPLADGLALHGAIVDAVSPDAPRGDWYRRHPRREDGGYLAALVAACREETARLPAAAIVTPALTRAARRCGEGQSHTHAAARAGGAGLEDWARGQPAASGYLWWEIAAGASSSVAAHALLAAAADRATTAEQAELLDALYFPSVGALTVLLDDMVDRDDDLDSGQHNYLDHYRDERQAADRIGLLAERARAATTHLRAGRRHRAILAGVAAFYLRGPANGSGYARPIRERLIHSLGSTVRPIMLAMRLRGDG
jgi:tetraprenyl-beta-curcumene synthase